MLIFKLRSEVSYLGDNYTVQKITRKRVTLSGKYELKLGLDEIITDISSAKLKVLKV